MQKHFYSLATNIIITKYQQNEIKSLIYGYVWDGKRDKVKGEVLANVYDKKALKVIDTDAYIERTYIYRKKSKFSIKTSSIFSRITYPKSAKSYLGGNCLCAFTGPLLCMLEFIAKGCLNWPRSVKSSNNRRIITTIYTHDHPPLPTFSILY